MNSMNIDKVFSIISESKNNIFEVLDIFKLLFKKYELKNKEKFNMEDGKMILKDVEKNKKCC